MLKWQKAYIEHLDNLPAPELIKETLGCFLSLDGTNSNREYWEAKETLKVFSEHLKSAGLIDQPIKFGDF